VNTPRMQIYDVIVGETSIKLHAIVMKDENTVNTGDQRQIGFKNSQSQD